MKNVLKVTTFEDIFLCSAASAQKQMGSVGDITKQEYHALDVVKTVFAKSESHKVGHHACRKGA